MDEAATSAGHRPGDLPRPRDLEHLVHANARIARHMRAAPSAGILLLQKLCQHGENESKRKRAHNEMHDQPPLVQVRVVAHHFGFLRDSREILRQTRAAWLPSATT
jgi:hypothetical protein